MAKLDWRRVKRFKAESEPRPNWGEISAGTEAWASRMRQRARLERQRAAKARKLRQARAAPSSAWAVIRDRDGVMATVPHAWPHDADRDPWDLGENIAKGQQRQRKLGQSWSPWEVF
jgi:hypothetical protein